MMGDNPILRAVLEQYCKELKLPGVLRATEGLARQAREDGWAYEEFLRAALEAEILSRHDHVAARRLKEAKFPEIKTLDQVDWKSLQGVSRPRLLELASCDFIRKRHDVVVVGPIGTGKTMLSIGLGVEACKKRIRVAFIRAAELVCELLEARDERRLARLHHKYNNVPLLIIDELGFVPFERAGGELLFNLLAERYERRSTIVTSNLAFGEWVQVLQCEKLTTALLDRLGHHSHILTTKGPSYRTKKRLQKDAPEDLNEDS